MSKREAKIKHGTQPGTIRVEWKIQQPEEAQTIIANEEMTLATFKATIARLEKDFGPIEVIDERKAD
ncbi:hypothetical protein [Oceanibaculum indicum]|uniref:Uncharacterized protein n=1 Tax=Oceanibaculum indicum P24 TaxID=1207063 RepID=K2JK21_9PROT|nr:hypothetical protein [Oceanibaculum indicum]EKE70909.1 hypothetical protein P24_15239 [Oceanibaculum indicum P24]